MDEFILPVCSPAYAHRMGLHDNPLALRHCTLLHDRQAWNKDCGEEEGLAWANHFGVSLPEVPGIGFDRSDLALVAALHDVGIAMGRRRLVQ